jgi:hypothetical protein
VGAGETGRPSVKVTARPTHHTIDLVKDKGLTPELTGRAHNADTDKLTTKAKLARAPVE